MGLDGGFQLHCTYQVDKIRVWDCTSCCKLALSPTLTRAWEQIKPMMEVEVLNHRNEVNMLHTNRRCGALSYHGVLHFLTLIPLPCSSLTMAVANSRAGPALAGPLFTDTIKVHKLPLCKHTCAITTPTDIANLQDLSSKPHQPMVHT